MPPVALTIAGSDPSGGAGIQADLKTFHQHRVYGASALTLVTVQNTRRVSRVELLDPALVREQIRAVCEDLEVDAAKTGALGSSTIVDAVAEVLAEVRRAQPFPLVVDPVMISKHGAPLLDAEARPAVARLLAVATLVTPNAHEAAALTGREVRTVAEAEDAARALLDLGVGAALVKGGHVDADEAVDVLATGASVTRLRGARIATTQTHGTGCTLSAAIAARLARGERLEDAVEGAKRWLSAALRSAPGVGRGVGPVDHLAPLAERGVGPVDHLAPLAGRDGD